MPLSSKHLLALHRYTATPSNPAQVYQQCMRLGLQWQPLQVQVREDLVINADAIILTVAMFFRSRAGSWSTSTSRTCTCKRTSALLSPHTIAAAGHIVSACSLLTRVGGSIHMFLFISMCSKMRDQRSHRQGEKASGSEPDCDVVMHDHASAGNRIVFFEMIVSGQASQAQHMYTSIFDYISALAVTQSHTILLLFPPVCELG